MGQGNRSRFCEDLQKFRLTLMRNEDRVKLAESTGIVLSREEAFWNYPLPGNITMRWWLQHMAEVFRNLAEEAHKDALRSMKLLQTGGILITPARVLALMQDVFGHNINLKSIDDILTILSRHHFLLKQPSTGSDCYHFGYIENVVSYQEGSEPNAERWNHLAQALEKIKDVEALLLLGNNQGRLGELARALQTVEAALRIDANNAQGHYQCGYTLARLGRHKEALRANRRALKLRNDFSLAWNNRGFILSCLGRFHYAEASLRRALNLDPKYPDAHTNLGIVLARTGRLPEAVDEIRTAVGLRQDNYYAYLSLAITLSRQNDLDEALTAIDKALEFRPDYPEAYFNRGIILAKKREFDKALVAEDRAIELRGNYSEALMHRGMTLLHLQRYEEAVEAHTKAIGIHNDYALAYLNRGLTYANMGKEHFKQATNDGQTALDLGNVPLHKVLGLAKTLGVNGGFAESRVIIEKVLSIAPTFPEAHLQLAIVLDCLNDRTTAQGEYAHAFELGLDTTELHEKWGRNLVVLERFDEAITEQTKVIKAKPNNAEAYDSRGLTYFNMRDHFNLALADFDRACELDSKNSGFHLSRAITLARLSWGDSTYKKEDREKDALDAYDKAILLDPQNVEAYFNKAKSLSLFARTKPNRMKAHNFEIVIEALTKAVAIDKEIIGKIGVEWAFDVWRGDPNYRERFLALIWKEESGTT